MPPLFTRPAQLALPLPPLALSRVHLQPARHAYHGHLGPIHQVISPAPRRARAGPPASSTPRQRTARPTDSPDPPVIPFLSPFHFPRRRLCSRSFPCAAPSLCAVDQPEIVARSPARAPLLEASPELGQARSLGEIRFPREPSRPQSPLRPSWGTHAQILGRLLLFSTPVALRLLSIPQLPPHPSVHAPPRHRRAEPLRHRAPTTPAPPSLR